MVFFDGVLDRTRDSFAAAAGVAEAEVLLPKFNALVEEGGLALLFVGVAFLLSDGVVPQDDTDGKRSLCIKSEPLSSVAVRSV